MNLLFASSEVAPYAKSGGLADVTSALPKALAAEPGTSVKVVLPLYASINREKYGITKLFDSACVRMGNCEEFYSVYTVKESSGVDVYFIEFNKYFGRSGFYHDHSGEYRDNAFRFAFFSRAALQLAKDLNFHPDIVHVNDWQTCFIPYYLKSENDPFFSGTKSVLTIHNLGYMGIFEPDVLEYAGIRPDAFGPHAFEAFGKTNLIKAGIHYADKITTVSPHYAQEILGPIGSNGLDGYLRMRQDDLRGILNGIDTNVWNPALDKTLPRNYDVSSYKEGKAACKKAIQKRMYLEESADTPLFAFIARFDTQKGITLLAECMRRVLDTMRCQIAVIGSGIDWAESFFGSMPFMYSGRAGAHIGYSEELAHQLEAGADFFIMPSLYEPCGLNQMYSLAYGTLPVVRATGGLEDTVQQYDEKTGGGTGFKFDEISGNALYYTIGWANSTYYDRPQHVDAMIRRAMVQDFSWERSCQEYLKLYREALGR